MKDTYAAKALLVAAAVVIGAAVFYLVGHWVLAPEGVSPSDESGIRFVSVFAGLVAGLFAPIMFYDWWTRK